jgi:hypothetical protein
LRQRRCDLFDRCFTRRLVCGKPLATSRLALSEHRGKQSVKLIIVEVPECARKICRQRVRWRCRDCGLVLRFWFACRQRVWRLLSREHIRFYRWIAAIAHMLMMPNLAVGSNRETRLDKPPLRVSGLCRPRPRPSASTLMLVAVTLSESVQIPVGFASVAAAPLARVTSKLTRVDARFEELWRSERPDEEPLPIEPNIEDDDDA